MTASSSSRLAFRKPRPHLLDKRKRAEDLARIDRHEAAKVRVRCWGRCEVWVQVYAAEIGRRINVRCTRRTTPGSHHLIGGSGRRNRGRSILAEHRLAVCKKCHEDITGHVLVPIGSQEQTERWDTVVYERRRS